MRWELNSLEVKFKYLEELGFKTPQHYLITIEEIPNLYQKFIDERESLEYDIDGIVFSVDDIKKMKSLGVLNEKQKPRGQIALKFPSKKIHVSKIIGVVYSFKGVQDISMVAEIEPVEIDGTIVKRASLKSARWVREHHVGLGSIVEIVKGGDIIPKIVRAVTVGEEGFPVLHECPYCGGDIYEGDAQLYCGNEWCSAKVAARISRFLKCLGVKGLAWKTLLKYANIGVTLTDFVARHWDDIESRVRLNDDLSNVIWAKVRKQLEEF